MRTWSDDVMTEGTNIDVKIPDTTPIRWACTPEQYYRTERYQKMLRDAGVTLIENHWTGTVFVFEDDSRCSQNNFIKHLFDSETEYLI